MSVFTNKHVVVALLVAPILAVISYFAIDALVGETPHAAKPGSRYELVEKPNCRYSSGACGLKNGEFELTLTTEWRDKDRMLLVLSSVYPLDGVMVALVQGPDDDKPPLQMVATDDSLTHWTLDMPRAIPDQHRLRVAASSNKSLYYGDAAMKFTLYETSFREDFRR